MIKIRITRTLADSYLADAVLPVVPAIGTKISVKTFDYGWVKFKVEDVVFELTVENELDYVELKGSII